MSHNIRWHELTTTPYTVELSPGEALAELPSAVSPSHYDKDGKQVWDTMKDLSTSEEYRGYLTLNVVKYLTRHKKKNGKEDLLKARAYLDKLIQSEYP